MLSQNTFTRIDEKKKFPAESVNVLSDMSNYKAGHKIVFTFRLFNPKTKLWETLADKTLYHTPVMLTQKEKIILPLMMEDKTAQEIASALGMNPLTVRTHWRNILIRTNCRTQKELKSMAKTEGWV